MDDAKVASVLEAYEREMAPRHRLLRAAGSLSYGLAFVAGYHCAITAAMHDMTRMP